MFSSFDGAWSQLSYHKVKLAVVMAVMLMLVQLCIRRGALDNSVAIARRISADLVIISLVLWMSGWSGFEPVPIHSLPNSNCSPYSGRKPAF